MSSPNFRVKRLHFGFLLYQPFFCCAVRTNNFTHSTRLKPAQSQSLLFVDSGSEYPTELPRINIAQKSVTFHEHTKSDDGPDIGRDKLSDEEEGLVPVKPQNTQTEKSSKFETPKGLSKYCFRLPKVFTFNSKYVYALFVK